MTWYLRTRYEDARRGDVRERHYLDDGEVWVVVNGDRSLVCRLSAGQLAAARAAVVAAHLPDLPDVPAETDLAVMTYEWRMAGAAGRWVDRAYPRVIPAAVDRLEETLLSLEEAADPHRSG